jgi:hypothetical protein
VAGVVTGVLHKKRGRPIREDRSRIEIRDNSGMHRKGLVRVGHLESSIERMRGHNVMLDEDLAALYQVDVKVLNQAVKRNRDRFPADFMFRLTAREAESLRSQIVTLNGGRGRHRKYRPFAFTEEGVAMLSGLLRSARAVRVNIGIMRAFVRFRQILAGNADFAKKLEELEARYDEQFAIVFQAIRQLMTPAAVPRKRIGFRSEKAGRPGGAPGSAETR